MASHSTRTQIHVEFHLADRDRSRTMIAFTFNRTLCINPSGPLSQIGAFDDQLTSTIARLRKKRGVDTLGCTGNGVQVWIGTIFDPRDMATSIVQSLRPLCRGSGPPLVEFINLADLDKMPKPYSAAEPVLLIQNHSADWATARSFSVNIRLAKASQGEYSRPQKGASRLTLKLFAELESLPELTSIRIDQHCVRIGIQRLADWSTVQPRVIDILRKCFSQPDKVVVLDETKAQSDTKPDLDIQVDGARADPTLKYSFKSRQLPIGTKGWNSSQHALDALPPPLRRTVCRLRDMIGVVEVKVACNTIEVFMGALFNAPGHHPRIMSIFPEELYSGRSKPKVKLGWKGSSHRTSRHKNRIRFNVSQTDRTSRECDLTGWLRRDWQKYPLPKPAHASHDHPAVSHLISPRHRQLIDALLDIKGVKAVQTAPYKVCLQFFHGIKWEDIKPIVSHVLCKRLFPPSTDISIEDASPRKS